MNLAPAHTHRASYRRAGRHAVVAAGRGGSAVPASHAAVRGDTR